MDREAFKQRMQSLKSYREQNPGKGYLDWKASLPDNLQDESSYNLQRAYELGYEPEYVEEDRSYHLPTRDQETGEILKKPWHPTFLIGLQEDAKYGNIKEERKNNLIIYNYGKRNIKRFRNL